MVCSALPLAGLAADPVVITSNLTILETDTTYDGADLVVDGAVTVAIDGSHAFNSISLTNQAVLTCSGSAPTYGLDLHVTGMMAISRGSNVDVTG